MSYFLLGALTVAAVIKKENKWIFGAILLFLMIMYCFNYSNPDYQEYGRVYRGLHGGVSDPLSIWLFTTAYNIGIPFQVFFAIWGIVGLSLIAFSIYKFSPYPAFVLAMYSWWPFCIDVVHMRFFMAYSIVFFSLQFIVDYHLTKKWQNIAFFVISVLIATGIHFSTIFFAILVVLFFDYDKYRKLLTFVFPAAIVIGIALLPTVASFVSSLLHTYKASLWVSLRVPTFAYLAKLGLTRGGMIVLCILAFYLVNRYLAGDEIAEETSEDTTDDFSNVTREKIIDQSFIYFVYYGMLLMSFEVLFDSVYERLMRFAIIAAYIFLSRMLSRTEGKFHMAFTIIWLMYMAGSVSIYLLTYGSSVGEAYLTRVFMELFNHNMLIPGL